jgi:DNA primase
MPQGKDPCDYLLSAGAERFEALLNSATEALEFKWHQVRRLSHDSGGIADSQRSVEDFLGLVARSVARESVDTVQWGFIAGRVGKLLAQPADEVYRYIKKLKDRERRQSPRSNDSPATENAPAAADIDEQSVRVILEVLLNAPEHAPLVRDRCIVERIRDSKLSRIARELLTACSEEQKFEVAAFVSRFEEPEMASLIIDLQHRGAHRGNLEETLVTTLNRLDMEQRTRDYDWPGTGEEKQSREQLQEVSKGTESRHLFHSKRHTRTMKFAQKIRDPALLPPNTEPEPRARA